MKQALIDAIEAAGYEIYDGRFVEGLGYFGLLTAAWDDADNIEIVEGDFKDFYRNSYKCVLLLSERTDLDNIDFDVCKTLQTVVGS